MEIVPAKLPARYVGKYQQLTVLFCQFRNDSVKLIDSVEEIDSHVRVKQLTAERTTGTQNRRNPAELRRPRLVAGSISESDLPRLFMQSSLMICKPWS